MHTGRLVLADDMLVGGRRTRLGTSVNLVPPAGLGVPPDCLVAWLLEPGHWVQPLTVHLHPDLGSAIILEGAQGGSV